MTPTAERVVIEGSAGMGNRGTTEHVGRLSGVKLSRSRANGFPRSFVMRSKPRTEGRSRRLAPGRTCLPCTRQVDSICRMHFSDHGREEDFHSCRNPVAAFIYCLGHCMIPLIRNTRGLSIVRTFQFESHDQGGKDLAGRDSTHAVVGPCRVRDGLQVPLSIRELPDAVR